MIQVAIVQEHLDPRRGGAESSVLELARHLDALGARASLLTASPLDPARGLSFADELRAIRTKASRTRRFVQAVEQRLAAAPHDLVLAVTPVRCADVYQPRGGLYDDAIERSLDVTRSAPLRWIKRAARRLNRRQQFLRSVEIDLLSRPRPPFIACVSDLVRRQIAQRFPAAAPAARVVFNGVDAEPLPPDAAASARAEWRRRLEIGHRPLVLFAAHNFRLKGLAALIDAAAVARRRGSPWRIVVAGRDRAGPFRRLAARRGVADSLTFLGPQDELRGLYAAADVLAHPTWYDPCSRVVLEALLHGLPVVTTKRNGAAEVVDDSLGRVIDSPSDPLALCDAVAAALALPRPSAAHAARQQRLSMRRHADELLDLLRQAAARRWPLPAPAPAQQ